MGKGMLDYIEIRYNDGTLCGRFRCEKDASAMALVAAAVTRQPVKIKAYYLDGSVGVGTCRPGERFCVPGRPLESVKREIAEKLAL